MAGTFDTPEFRDAVNVETQRILKEMGVVRRQKVLLYYPHFESLVRDVVTLEPSIMIGEIKWQRFPDCFPNLFVNDIRSLQDKDVSFLASFSDVGTVFEQVSMMYHLAEFNPRSLRYLLPYFPTGTMERIDNEGQVATAATLAQMLSAVPPSGHGPIPLFIWDMHALQIRHYFGPNITPRPKSGLKYLQKMLRADPDAAIAFPDSGAWKRYKRMFTEADHWYEFIVCDKVRGKGEVRTVTIKEGDPVGKHVVIVDDLIQSGSTMVECKNVLLAAGAKAVSVYATHGVFAQDSWKKFVNAGFNKVWITESCPLTAAKLKGVKPFEIISLAESVVNAIFDR